ncbi:MAG: cellulase [Vallitaleaceae bacterium]|nr:cellulase [Vallitaleaceae bacterium]
MKKLSVDRPIAITMWDFSWLERRWAGAGYEDWDQVLIELKVRGYDAVRIDAYPHLLAVDPDKEWLLFPEWDTQTWGSPANNKVVVKENLKLFLETCKRHQIKVALSTWFREDADNIRMNITTPKKLGEIWERTLDYIKEWELMDVILYVDLCNEFPLGVWAPFVEKVEGKTDLSKESIEATRWMKESVQYLNGKYDEIPTCFSFAGPYDHFREIDVSFMDLIEPHVWMTVNSDFYEIVGYNYERFSSVGYDNLALKGEKLYRESPEVWKASLKALINDMAIWSKETGKPLVTTECWSVVDYKDWPLLNWDWIKELCEFGVTEAAKTGKWAMIATSNFCGPQFVGMWRDVEWHQRMTELIHNSHCEY